MDLKERFLDEVTKKGLIRKGQRVLLSLSGGSDSVFLFYMLLSLHNKGTITLSCFHLDHNLRETAKRDEDFVKKLCEDNSIRSYIYSYDCEALSKEAHESVETYSRNLRYDLIDRIMDENDIDVCMTAHHMDDDMETILMHIIRGTSPKGLIGIPEVNGKIVRPLLNYTKSEMQAYLEENKLAYVTDETNFELDHFRNRVRNLIVPILEKENPKIGEAIRRLSNTTNEMYKTIEKLSEKVDISIDKDEVSMSIKEAKSLERSVLSLVLDRMFILHGVTSDISYENKSSVMDLVYNNDDNWEIHIHKLSVRRQYDKLIVSKKKLREKVILTRIYPKIPSTIIFSNASIVIDLKLIKNTEKVYFNSNIKIVDYDKIKNDISISSRSESDWFIPLGSDHKKTLHRYMIDKKIPAILRDSIPVIYDGDDVVCIVGYQIDERYKVDDSTSNILVIEEKEME